jgi:uncharacterized protein YndB with AHSA1/START domain
MEIAAPADAVWRALTDATELTRWFPLEARVTPEVGGSVWMRWNDLYEGASRIEIWEPGTHLRLAFPLDGPGPVATDYYLAGRGGTTTLRVVTSGFGEGADWDAFYDGVHFGWTFELCALRHYVERHLGADRRVVWVQRPYPADRDDAWRRLTGARGWLASAGSPVAEGKSYALRTASGDELRGLAHVWRPPALFVGTVERWNHALLRVETWRKPAIVSVWLATYGVPAGEVAGIEAAWETSIETALASGRGT